METDEDILIGEFLSREKTDKRAYLVANASTPYPENRKPFINVSLRFDGVQAVTVYKPSKQAEYIRLKDGVLEMQIPCGEGYFITIE